MLTRFKALLCGDGNGENAAQARNHRKLLIFFCALATGLLLLSWLWIGKQALLNSLLVGTMLLHLAWYLWVVFGVSVTRGRVWLSMAHVSALLWGVAVQTARLQCPLTLAEQALRARLGNSPYSGGFAVHYLGNLVDPSIPHWLYLYGSLLVCIGSLAVYAIRGIGSLSGRRARAAMAFAVGAGVIILSASALETVVYGTPIAQILHFSVIPNVTGTDGSTTGIASFTGNASIVSTTGVAVGLVRQPDCSLSLMSGGYSIGSLGFTQTLISANYEKVLHSAAGLSTTSNTFPSGCASPKTGFPARPVVYVGKTTGGINVFAAVSDDPVAGVRALYVMNTNTSTISFVDMPTAKELTTADLNGDGNGDLVLLNSQGTSTGSVTVELGKADGTFGTAVQYATAGAGAVSATIDDVNGDGKLDLIVATNDQHISVLTGKGDGTFNTAQSFTATLPGGSSTPIAEVITADVNNDGKKDILCSNGLVLLGNGDGTFTSASKPAFPYIASTTTANGPHIASGDFNHDGNADLAVGNGATVSIWLGDGHGAFSQGSTYASIDSSGWITATDLDGDGNLDIYCGLANGGFFGGDHSSPAASYAFMGYGDGTFAAAPLAPGTSNGANVIDVNGDGIPDMLLPTTGAINGQTAVFSVSLGTSKGIFVPTSTVVAPATVTFTVSQSLSPVTESTSNLTPASYAVGDLNGDGKADVAWVANYRDYAVYFVAFGNGDGTFGTAAATGFPQIAPSSGYDVTTVINSLRIGDFTHDGKADLVFNFNDTAGPFGTGLYLQGLGVLPGSGSGGFGSPILTYTYNSGTVPGALGIPSISSILDLNGDGLPDLIASDVTFALVGGVGVTTSTVQIYAGKADGTFAAPTAAITTTNLGQIAVGDFNKDGKTDIAALAENATAQAQLMIAPGNGNGSFGTPAVYKLPGGDAIRSAGLVAADFNGDGNVDLALLDSNDFSGVFYGKGDSTFTSVPFNGNIIPKDLINLAVDGTSVAIDLNKDGKPDILAGNTILINQYGSTTTPPSLVATSTSVTAPSGTGTVGSSVTFTATVTPASGTAMPSGTVTFLDGSSPLGTGTLSSNQATYTTSALAIGTHSITAVYGGDTSFAGSTSTAFSFTVAAQTVATTTTLSSSANSAPVGTGITFSATVAQASGSAVPGGSVAFTDGGTTLGSATLDGSGKAQLTTSTLAVGSHTVAAVYAGSTGFGASTSASVAVTITSSPTPDFALGISPASGTVSRGNSISTVLSITPANGFNLPVTLQCSGAPSGDTCTISPTTVTPNGTSASTATVTLQTTVGSASLRNTRPLSLWALTLPLGFLGLWLTGSKSRKRFPKGVAMMSLSLVLVFAVGCGHSTQATSSPRAITLTLTGSSGTIVHTTSWNVTAQ